MRAFISGGARVRGRASALTYFTSFLRAPPRRAAESAVFINLTFPSVYHVNN